jgi:hypothetical protein
MGKGMFSKLRARLRDLATSERGIALPVALFAMISSMALASAAVMATVDVQQGSKRDSSSKSAIAAADAGANIARLRMNRYAYVLSAANPCLRVGGGGNLEATAAEGGWCPPVTGTVGGAAYSYRTTPVGVACGTYNLCVVATGTAAGVSRRIEVTYNSGTPVGGEKITEFEKKGVYNPGANEGVISFEDLHVENSDVGVSVGSNGNVILDNNGIICGNIRNGVGKSPLIAKNGVQCSGYQKTEGNITMPPVSSFMPGNIATVNSNYRLVTCTQTKPVNAPTGCQLDSYAAKKRTPTSPWDPGAKTLTTENGSSLTLSGGDYFMCKLILSNNSHLIMGGGYQVRVFFDTPEHCGLGAGAKQIDISNGADITATGYQTTPNNFEMPGFYLLGSTSIPTKIELSNNSGTNEFVLYGPNTEIIVKNNAIYKGLIAGKKVLINNNAVIRRDPRFVLSPELNPWKETETTVEKTRTTPTALYFQPQAYFECGGGAAPAGGAPNANC